MESRGDVPNVSGARLALLRRLGVADLEHDSHVPFLSHLVGTRRLLIEWGCPAALCDAGLFHSVYGTEYFDAASTATRPEVRQVLGVDAERLAWLWCTIERDTLDPELSTAIDRHTGRPLDLATGDAGDLATLWSADTVEQIRRMDPGERGFAAGLPRVLPYATPPAREAVADVLDLIP